MARNEDFDSAPLVSSETREIGDHDSSDNLFNIVSTNESTSDVATNNVTSTSTSDHMNASIGSDFCGE